MVGWMVLTRVVLMAAVRAVTWGWSAVEGQRGEEEVENGRGEQVGTKK